MADFITLAKINDIPDGKMKEFRLAGKVITVAGIDGEYLAFDGICTHEHCSLAGGFLDGFTLTCYCHGAQFDVTSGQVLGPPATEGLKTYETKVEGDELKIKL
ncbi:MAG: Rieske (2Fe-2S) domain-containing protein [Candidatus Gottesmanbacteria bacterium GW2011_GWA2_43_14]|uniref:Rieske (2Fe-2S) domain-containing protein n=1 Tax=Candidatus Gottesmanbacteria bacterium GW2011_GWA2_43_14 TaxID=1618443 RepID=A0A0G1DFM8_9BACT|nr:MAG: Rieske (2Fe-2S) domain-containing protein [Candidatus Gottesmanbacteria bacterium GW2011_GWA2_43_14]